MNDLELKLKISASAIEAIKAFGDLKKSLSETSLAVAAAQKKTADLAQEFNTNREQSEALRIQQSLGKAELDRLAASAGKASPEYRALAAEVKQVGADLKIADIATAQSEQAFTAARAEVTSLKGKLDEMREAVHRHRTALQGQGVDVSQLASEYTRLKREADAANLAQSQKASIAADRDALGITPHADTHSKIADIHAAVERLRESGKLTFAEMAQAELKASEITQGLHQDLNGVGESLASLQGDLIEFGTALATVYATADQAIKFESGFAGVAKVVDASAGELAALSDEILNMTRALPNAASELLSIAESAGSLGIAANEVDEFTEGVAKLSAAFKMQAAETADYAAGIKNGFGLTVAQVLELGDAVNTLGNKYAATENDILNVDARIAASAKTFGLSAEQASAMATTLLSLKNPPEVAATAINGLLSRLQSVRVQSPEFQKALKDIGVDANQLANDIAANPQKALEGFLGTLKGLDNSSLAEATNQLIGQGGDATALQQLVQNLGQYQEAVGTATDKTQTAGAVEREFAAQMATTEAQLSLVKNAVVELAVNVGSTLLPAILAGANATQSFINALADAAKANPELTKLLAIFAPLIAGAGLLNGIGLRLAVMWGTVTAAFAAGGAASVAMSGGLGTVLAAVLRLVGGPIGLLILALTTLADWWGHNKDKEVAFGDESVTMGDIVRTTWSLLVQAAQNLAGFLADRFGQMGADITNFALEVKNGINVVIGIFTGLGKGAGEGLAVFVEDVRRHFDQAVKLAQAAGKDIKAAARLDFSTNNYSQQKTANAQEELDAKARQGGAGFANGFGTAYDTATKGDAAQKGIVSIMDTAGQAVTDWTTELRGDFRAQMARDQNPAKAASTEDRADAGGGNGLSQDKPGGRHIDWGGNDSKGGGGGAGDTSYNPRLAEIKAGMAETRAAYDAELKDLENHHAERKALFVKSNADEFAIRDFALQEERNKSKAQIDLKRLLINNLANAEQAALEFEKASDEEKRARYHEIDRQRQADLNQLQLDAKARDIEFNNQEVANAKAKAEELKAIDAVRFEAKRNAQLADIELQRQIAGQELALGKITQEQHLERLRELAKKELELRLKILDDERKLHPNDPVAQARITAEEQQLKIKFKSDWTDFDTTELTGKLKDAKDSIASIFAPLTSAIDQTVSSLVSGQQTLVNAARNAGQSMLLSYIQQSVKTRLIAVQDAVFKSGLMQKLLGEKKQFDLLESAWDAAMWVRKRIAMTLRWAWEIAGFGGVIAQRKAMEAAQDAWHNLLQARQKIRQAALWVWDKLGFAETEAEKVAVKGLSETAQTGAQVVGDGVRTISAEAAGEAKKKADSEAASQSIFGKAYDAAAGVYSSLSQIPYVGWILAPIAAAATLVTVLGWGAMVGSAKGGEYMVKEDGMTYKVHEREAILPAGVADNFRHVVEFVKSGGLPDKTAAINDLVAAGQLKGNWTLPASVAGIAQAAQDSAKDTVKNGSLTQSLINQAEQPQQIIYQNTHNNPINFSPVYNNQLIDGKGAAGFFNQHSEHLVRVLKDKTRKGAFGAAAMGG
jgi:TP901 family phage tail tape measure protein